MLKRIFIFLIVLNILSILSPHIEVNSQVQLKNSESGKIRIASCQFPVSSDIKVNYKWIEEQMIEAKLKKANIVHFPECALSGSVSYTHLRAHETRHDLVCRLLLEKKK